MVSFYLLTLQLPCQLNAKCNFPLISFVVYFANDISFSVYVALWENHQ